MGDLTIKVNGRLMTCNKDVLMKRSEFFRAALSGDFAAETEFTIPNRFDVSERGFGEMISKVIRYLHGREYKDQQWGGPYLCELAVLHYIANFLAVDEIVLQEFKKELLHRAKSAFIQVYNLGGLPDELSRKYIEYIGELFPEDQMEMFYIIARAEGEFYFPEELRFVWEAKILKKRVREYIISLDQQGKLYPTM